MRSNLFNLKNFWGIEATKTVLDSCKYSLIELLCYLSHARRGIERLFFPTSVDIRYAHDKALLQR